MVTRLSPPIEQGTEHPVSNLRSQASGGALEYCAFDHPVHTHTHAIFGVKVQLGGHVTPAALVLQAVPLSERTAIVLVALGDGHRTRPQNQPSVYRAVLTTLKQTQKKYFLKKATKKEKKRNKFSAYGKGHQVQKQNKGISPSVWVVGVGGGYIWESI